MDAETKPEQEIKPQQVAWEDRKNTGVLGGWITTWKEVVFSPAAFFNRVSPQGKITDALTFGIIPVSISIIVSAVIAILYQVIAKTPPVGMTSQQVILINAILIVTSPLLATIGLFIGSAIYHLFVLLCGGRKGFRATFRTMGYTNAIALFSPIPIAGPLFVGIYSIVLLTKGFKRVHAISTARAVWAVLIPVILGILLFVIAAVLLGLFLTLTPGAAGTIAPPAGTGTGQVTPPPTQ